MSSDPLELKEKTRAEYFARWEAVETFKAHELAAMTEERARQIMTGRSCSGWERRKAGANDRIGPAWSNSKPSFTKNGPSD